MKQDKPSTPAGGTDEPNLIERFKSLIVRLAIVKETDGELLMTQKITYLFFAVLSIPIFALSIYFWVVVGGLSDGASAARGTVVGASMITAFGVVFAGSYLLLRMKGNSGNMHVHIYYFLIEALWLVLVLAIPGFGLQRGTIAMMVGLVINQPPLLLLHFVIPLSTVAIDLANEVFDAKVYLPGFRDSDPAEHLIVALVVWCADFLIVLVIYAKTVSSAAQFERNRLTVEMSNQVVALLQSYDTEGVNRSLAEYKANHDVDPKLLDALKAMNENLERYRPHLPNYVLMADENDDDEGEEEGEGDEKIEYDGRSSRGHRPRRTSVGGTPESAPIWESDRMSVSSRTPSVRSDSQSQRNGSHTYARAGAWEKVGPRNNMTGAAETSPQRFIGRITLSQIDFLSIPVDRRMECIPGLVDCIYQHAATCHASIHSLLGDTLTVSWNATRRVAQSELKATRFLYKVQRAMAEKGLAVCGAACTGSAACESVQSSTGQQAFLVHCRWRDALQVLVSLAARCHSVLIDEATNAVAHYDFDTRAVDQLSYVNPTGGLADPRPQLMVNEPLFHGHRGHANLMRHFSAARLSGGESISPSQPAVPATDTVLTAADNTTKISVFEVVEEFKREDDEWMYQLEGNNRKKTFSTDVTRGFVAATRGDFAEASQILSAVIDGMSRAISNSNRNQQTAPPGYTVGERHQPHLPGTAASFGVGTSPRTLMVVQLSEYCDSCLSTLPRPTI